MPVPSERVKNTGTPEFSLSELQLSSFLDTLFWLDSLIDIFNDDVV